jgi:hypothetical protein
MVCMNDCSLSPRPLISNCEDNIGAVKESISSVVVLRPEHDSNNINKEEHKGQSTRHEISADHTTVYYSYIHDNATHWERVTDVREGIEAKALSSKVVTVLDEIPYKHHE